MKSSENQEVILIIDDNEENHYTFGRYLKRENFEVWTADTGAKGLGLAQKRPSLIILDIQLPDTTGYEVCRALKNAPETSSIPVLHTSATFTDSSDRTAGLEGGADGYLTQPIDAEELVATVKALLRVRTAELSAKLLASEWQITFDAISDGLCLVNGQGNIERFNRAFADLFQGSKPVRAGDSLQSLLGEIQGHEGVSNEFLIKGRWHRATQNKIKETSGHAVGEAWVFSDIDAIREAEIKVQNLNQELENRVVERTTSLQEALHQLEQFSYAVSHDLRAPLRAMSGYSNALLEDYAQELPERASNYLGRIAKSAARLDKMIVDVLTFTKISRATPELEALSVEKVVRDIMENYPGLKPSHAKVTIDTPYYVMANESALTQALSNMIGNAIKFVRPGVFPEVRIWSEEKSDMVRISIQDNGIGIPPESQNRLFGMFERVLPTSEYEGTGIGLAIAHKAVERMGGSVGMSSDGGNGSVFWTELKKANEAPV
jgi:signal transduction histidine kinase/CheY-like chemotaxis protein